MLFRSEKIQELSHPILIEGGGGAGKTSLAWYLALKTGLPVVLNLKDIPQTLHKQLIESALYQNETVIIENLYVTNDETVGLLTAYTDDRIKEKNMANAFKFKCIHLILTTVNSSDDKTKKSQCWQKLYSRLTHRTISMLNLNDFQMDLYSIIRKCIEIGRAHV